MRLLIISGRSGSGKTISLNVLEDLGYYCVDNLPVEMLLDLTARLEHNQERLAVSIDSRNLPTDVMMLKDVVAKLNKPGRHSEIIYLDADDTILLKRFSETRRRHPLTKANLTLKEAIKQEKALLSPIANMANWTVDTSKLSPHQLCTLIQEHAKHNHQEKIQLLIQSFGFKNGLPSDLDYVFDVRCLPNPYWQPGLRAYTGLDPEVHQYLSNQPLVNKMSQDIQTFLENWIPQFAADNRSYLSIGIGCTGGQHRSVYLTKLIADQLKKQNYAIQTRHRDLPFQPKENQG